VVGKINSASGKELDVTFGIRHLTPEERKKNALKGLGLFWGLSLASIPLPPIHWVTVPGFFLFGIYFFFRKLRQHDHFEKLEFSCPECGKEVKLPEQVVQNPLAFVCPHCRYGLKLSFEAPSV
jgi:DNA-directed RNA polymerase subunit RPC12/RpoP